MFPWRLLPELTGHLGGGVVISRPSEASLALTCPRPTSGLTLMTDYVYTTYFLGMHEVLAKTQEATRNKEIISGCPLAGV